MNQPVQLSLEKQLTQRDFEMKVARMSHAQAQEMCIKLNHLMLCKDQVTSELMKRDIGSMFNGSL